MKPGSWHEFKGQEGSIWVELENILAIEEYHGGSFHPCNGGSILTLPFGSRMGVQDSPEKVMALVEKFRSKE